MSNNLLHLYTDRYRDLLRNPVKNVSTKNVPTCWYEKKRYRQFLLALDEKATNVTYT